MEDGLIENLKKLEDLNKQIGDKAEILIKYGIREEELKLQIVTLEDEIAHLKNEVISLNQKMGTISLDISRRIEECDLLVESRTSEAERILAESKKRLDEAHDLHGRLVKVEELRNTELVQARRIKEEANSALETSNKSLEEANNKLEIVKLREERAEEDEEKVRKAWGELDNRKKETEKIYNEFTSELEGARILQAKLNEQIRILGEERVYCENKLKEVEVKLGEANREKDKATGILSEANKLMAEAKEKMALGQSLIISVEERERLVTLRELRVRKLVQDKGIQDELTKLEQEK